MRFLAPLLFIVAWCCNGSAIAAQHFVRPGDDWSRLAERLRPGDEVLFFPGTHRQALLENIAGSAEKPIIIRSLDPKAPVTIEAQDVGIHLKNVRHVRVDGFFITGARRAGIIVAGEADASAEDVELRNVYVAKTGDLAEKAGIWIGHARSVTVRSARIEGWHGAGVHVAASECVRILGTQFMGTVATPDTYGVAVDGGSRNLLVERCSFQGNIESMVGIGLAPPPPASSSGSAAGASDPGYLAREITIERCLGDRTGRLAVIGSCRDVLLRANTLSEPIMGYEIVAPPRGWGRPTNVLIVSNLFAWTPSRLQRFASAAPDVDPTGVKLEVNLWFSEELPAARSLLGEFAGTIAAPQILDVNPRFDGTFRPMEERAKGFGLEAP